MLINIMIIFATMIIALNGLLFQTKIKPEGPVQWRNVNLFGKILFALIIFLTGLNIFGSYINEKQHANEVNQFLTSQNELKEINRHLIKVISVADGYNAIIRGVVVFRRDVNETQIRNALKNLFLKYAEIDLHAENKLGEYQGRIDYAAHPEVRKFLSLNEVESDSYFFRYKEYFLGDSYFFEIRCTGIKILNDEKIQYARFSPNEHLSVRAKTFAWSRDYGRLYHVESVWIDEIEIEELENIRLEEMLNF
jgi:hypothetical protein